MTVGEFWLRLKNGGGRPRPPALNERSTRPFVSSTFRCFRVAIFEIRSSPAMSDRETDPRRFNVRRICRFADENPASRSEEHTSELQSQSNLVCRLLLEKKKRNTSRP